MSDILIDSQRMMIELQESTIQLLREQVEARDKLIATLEAMVYNQEQQIKILTGQPVKPKLILINGGSNE
jgi:hypothetical protein